MQNDAYLTPGGLFLEDSTCSGSKIVEFVSDTTEVLTGNNQLNMKILQIN